MRIYDARRVTKVKILKDTVSNSRRAGSLYLSQAPFQQCVEFLHLHVHVHEMTFKPCKGLLRHPRNGLEIGNRQL